MKKLLLCAMICLPLPSFAFNFCRVDLIAETTEKRVAAYCDGNIVVNEGAGRNSLGYTLFSKILGDILARNLDLKVVNCEGKELATCYLAKK